MMSCTHDKERLSAWHDGALPEADRATVTAHIEACAECRSIVEEYRTIGGTIRALPRVKAPPSVLEAVRRAIATPTNEIPFPQGRAISFALAAAAALLIAVNLLVYFNNPPENAGSDSARTPTPETRELAGTYDREKNASTKLGDEKTGGVRAENDAIEHEFKDAGADDHKKQDQAGRVAGEPPATPPEATQKPADPTPTEAQVESRVLVLALGGDKDRNRTAEELAGAIEGYRSRGRFEKELAESGKPVDAPQAEDAEELQAERYLHDGKPESFTIEITEAEYEALTKLASAEGSLVVDESALMSFGALEPTEERRDIDKLAQGFVESLKLREQLKREAPPENELARKGATEEGGRNADGADETPMRRSLDPEKAKEARWIRVTVYLLSREELLRRARELDEKPAPAENP